MIKNNFVIEQKIIARKNIAKYSKLLKKANLRDRLTIIKKIALERSLLDCKVNEYSLDNFTKMVHSIRQAEMAIELPGAPAQNNQIVAPLKLNLGQFIDALEQDLRNEESQLQLKTQTKQAPTENAKSRWARKWSFLQYYKNMNLSPEIEITKNDGDDKTMRQLAPNKQTIYNMYIDKLEELRRRSDEFKLSDEEFNQALDGGTPQGGAFEKWLERHREEVMNKLYTNR